MRTLIFGGTGMLGRAVTAEFRRRHHAALGLSRGQADIREPASLKAHAAFFRPQLIVNCAAFTRVDACEIERELAFGVNGTAVANVVAAAEHVGADLIQVSTDYVFDGKAKAPYREEADTGPLSVYGLSKLRGEEQARRYERALVLRTSWLFGPGGPNFVASIRKRVLAGGPLEVVDDQVGYPTYTPFVARAICDLAPLGKRGVLHYRNREAISWHGFATEIVNLLGVETEVRSTSTAEYERNRKEKDPEAGPMAPRPAYSELDVTRFEAAVGRRVEPWVSGLALYLETLGNDS